METNSGVGCPCQRGKGFTGWGGREDPCPGSALAQHPVRLRNSLIHCPVGFLTPQILFRRSLNCHRPRGFKQREVTLRHESQKCEPRCLKAPGRVLPASSSFWWLPTFLGLWLHRSFSAPIITRPLSPLLSLIRTLVIGCRGLYSDLILKLLITPATTLFPIRSHSEVLHVFGGHPSTAYRWAGARVEASLPEGDAFPGLGVGVGTQGSGVCFHQLSLEPPSSLR